MVAYQRTHKRLRFLKKQFNFFVLFWFSELNTYQTNCSFWTNQGFPASSWCARLFLSQIEFSNWTNALELESASSFSSSLFGFKKSLPIRLRSCVSNEAVQIWLTLISVLDKRQCSGRNQKVAWFCDLKEKSQFFEPANSFYNSLASIPLTNWFFSC